MQGRYHDDINEILMSMDFYVNVTVTNVFVLCRWKMVGVYSRRLCLPPPYRGYGLSLLTIVSPLKYSNSPMEERVDVDAVSPVWVEVSMGIIH